MSRIENIKTKKAEDGNGNSMNEKRKRKHSRPKKKIRPTSSEPKTSSASIKDDVNVKKTSNSSSLAITQPAKKIKTAHMQNHTRDLQQQQQQRHKPSPPSQEALHLSSQLKQYTTQKNLAAALQLYRSPSHASIIDMHHLCIMVDCCARCGNIALGQKIVDQFVTDPNNSHVRTISVQTQTALMKGYAHSGDIQKAQSLYDEMVRMGKKNRRDRPNVRTLNTLLRGCLWAAVTIDFNTNVNANANATTNVRANANASMSGGIITADAVWPRGTGISSIMIKDTSSYEYYITLLSQALRCKDVLTLLEEFMNDYKIKAVMIHDQKKPQVKTKDNANTNGSTSITQSPNPNPNSCNRFKFTADDPSVLETLGVSFFNLARAHAMLGDRIRAREYANKSIDVVMSAREIQRQSKSQPHSQGEIQVQAGGKRSWKEGPSEGGRRDVSNSLFRAHKLTELEGDANLILQACQDENDGGRGRRHGKQEDIKNQAAALQLARMLVAKVLYFSGGGTTDLSASAGINCNVIDIDSGDGGGDSQNVGNGGGNSQNVQRDRRMLMNSLWHSFGLSEAMKCAFPSKTFHERRQKSVLTPLTDNECASILQALGIKASYVLMEDGTIDFSTVTNVIENDSGNGKNNGNTNVTQAAKKSGRDLNIELGSGFGEWAVHQAKTNPRSDYIAVEMRSDRVGQMFSKGYLNGNGGRGNANSLSNLCCVGAECGSFLRSRVKQGSVSSIFVNHPEPPTQTLGANSALLKTLIEGGEEPAHMLSSETLLSAARCLDDAKGRLVIVTDNRWYANLICATLLKVMKENDDTFHTVPLDQRSGFTAIETFHGGTTNLQVTLYEGQPNESIGHLTASTSSQGSTYFDRLWRKGAGTHADAQKRFVICMCRSKASGRSSVTGKLKSAVTGKVAAVQQKNKKKSATKQQRRNERRMKKKAGASK
jgi:pentatricopeptide repeat protein